MEQVAAAAADVGAPEPEPDAVPPPRVVIVGAGLVGALNACFMAQRGWTVDVYDLRPDIRTMEHVAGRSINLALSQRGKAALDEVGLREYIVERGVPMYARLVHDPDGSIGARLPYGQPGEHIVSINRRHLNESLITKAEERPGVRFHFEHKLLSFRHDTRELLFEHVATGERVTVTGYELACGCDGAFSALRRSLMLAPRFDYSQAYIEHGYVELNIGPTDDDQFALEPNVFHLWPRGRFTLIALANTDKTFTVTLFAPFDVFERRLRREADVLAFFERHFADALALIGRESVCATFRTVPPQSLVTVKCRPHHFGEDVLLLGDAAHAMVPFYGQGMNCGFEDCLVLKEALDAHAGHIGAALAAYSAVRCVDAHAIGDLALYNYLELRDLVNKASFRARKRLDNALHWLAPAVWRPLYTMVTFSRVRYHLAVEHRRWQDQTLAKAAALLKAACAAGGVALVWLVAKRCMK